MNTRGPHYRWNELEQLGPNELIKLTRQGFLPKWSMTQASEIGIKMDQDKDNRDKGQLENLRRQIVTFKNYFMKTKQGTFLS